MPNWSTMAASGHNAKCSIVLEALNKRYLTTKGSCSINGFIKCKQMCKSVLDSVNSMLNSRSSICSVYAMALFKLQIVTTGYGKVHVIDWSIDQAAISSLGQH